MEFSWLAAIAAAPGMAAAKQVAELSKPAPVDENWMRVAPGTDAAIWRPWSRETGEL